MGFLDTTSNVLDTAVKAINNAAFNSYSSDLYNFRTRPVGLYQKSYKFMLDHLYRNIGNSEYIYDGYSTPVGELANPFYNTTTKVPWFYNDDYKNSTSNYLDYIRSVYGATLSVENINSNDLFHISEDASAVGAVDGVYAIEALANDSDLIPNNNGTGRDTYMAIDSGYYNRETLRNAVVANDKRNRFSNGITEGLRDFLGLTTENITEVRAFSRRVSNETGRLADGVFNPLEIVNSPVEASNYGHYYDIGSYTPYYNFLTEESKTYYEANVLSNSYYPAIVDDGLTYLDSAGIIVGHDTLFNSRSEDESIDELQIRYIFKTLEEHSNVSDVTNGGVYVYTESEDGVSTEVTFASFNSGARFGRYTSYGLGLTANDLLFKTSESFKTSSYKTIIARFHTDSDEAEVTDTTQSAVSGKYGMSHGRNLLKTFVDDSEGYENPYCRVWTFHHQYHRLADAIRPLEWSAEELYGKYNFSAFTADHSNKGFENGRIRLEKYGSLNKNNGLVNITPIDSSDSSKKVDIRNCMFSIENLAWKDVFSTDASSRATFQAGGLSSEQKGPFGGRIMWFPPYDLKFSENVSVNWNENNFIGRGEGIYTYTNTTRSGNLSFKILVDHPSIIDYWEGRGRSVSDSVDDIDDPEQELLRFFAGCDMLTAKPGPEPEPVPVVEDEPVPAPETQVLKFYVFYPNNYSGVDDDVDFAMKYLTNGLGAGKERKSESGKTVDYKIPYATSYKKSEVTEGYVYGGYEMRPGRPISMHAKQEEKNLLISDAIVGSTDVKLYVQEGDKNDTWWQRRWYYRSDKEYQNQILKKSNYIDSASYCLNSKLGQSKVIEHFSVEDESNLYSFADVYAALEGGNVMDVLKDEYKNDLYDEDKVNSFKNKLKQYEVDYVECIGMASVQGHKKLNSNLQINRAKTIKRWLSSKPYFDASHISTTTGGTGGEGEGINNGDENAISNKLWRCAEVSIHLKSAVSKTAQASLSENFTPTDGSEEMHQNNHLNTPDTTVAGYENMGVGRTRNFNDLSGNKMYEERVSNDKVTSVRMNHMSDNTNGLALNLRSSSRNKNVDLNDGEDVYYDDVVNGNNDYRSKSTYDYSLNSMHDNAAQDEVAGLYNTQEDKADIAIVDGNNYGSNMGYESTYGVRQGTSNNPEVRYDCESKFFSMLEKEEPVLHHKISDKVKYFDPAFHSISPEGFNARLTFLQQCTRQGPTIGNSDAKTEDSTANNLAFGRPPVCILRIGDFYYTKILIESLNIDFDPLMWDLNTEGIGVMPMVANVTLNFKFIGGSSLAGHITRLQNALSFNYYANTEVYDNRSEMASYDNNGNIERFGTEEISL